ncbi:acetylornithine/N-succinyldiaminopimelate aminotransferase, partial [Candidatus Hakubella thermalkaliphila]
AIKWIERDEETMAPYNRPFYYPLVVAGGEGAIIRDVDGNEYIDWNSGLGVLNVGQCNPKIVEAMTNKAKSFMHYSYTDFRFTEPVELAERLNKILPMQCKYFFANSGTEANEAAFKIARHFTKRQLFIGFIDSFHGRTFGTIAFSSTSPAQRRHFHPLMPGVTLVP